MNAQYDKETGKWLCLHRTGGIFNWYSPQKVYSIKDLKKHLCSFIQKSHV